MVLEIPENIEKALGKTPEEARRRALELFALDGHKSERLTHLEVRQLLGLSWHETEQFLHDNGAMLHYTPEELRHEVEAMNKALGRR
jgi:hypothetical protein